MKDLCEKTMRHVFKRLRDDHPDAALEVATMVLGRTDPVEWAQENASAYENKIHLIKAIRNEFGLTLKEAKEVANEVYSNFDDQPEN